MNKLTSLFKTFDSLNLHINSKMTPIMDIKACIVSDQYLTAAHHIRSNIQKMESSDPAFDKVNHDIQVLEMVHNVIIDKEKEYQLEYFDSLFELIKTNLQNASIDFNYPLFKSSMYNLKDKNSYDTFIQLVKTWNNQEFKHKEATALFAAKILQTHDHLINLESKYI